jgi:hypothetical protein
MGIVLTIRTIRPALGTDSIGLVLGPETGYFIGLGENCRKASS